MSEISYDSEIEIVNVKICVNLVSDSEEETDCGQESTDRICASPSAVKTSQSIGAADLPKEINEVQKSSRSSKVIHRSPIPAVTSSASNSNTKPDLPTLPENHSSHDSSSISNCLVTKHAGVDSEEHPDLQCEPGLMTTENTELWVRSLGKAEMLRILSECGLSKRSTKIEAARALYKITGPYKYAVSIDIGTVNFAYTTCDLRKEAIIAWKKIRIDEKLNLEKYAAKMKHIIDQIAPDGELDDIIFVVETQPTKTDVRRTVL
ncbi:hypothetical protein BKA69DRAFT_1132549, partial [Paraphysoderma sedebokerense]